VSEKGQEETAHFWKKGKKHLITGENQTNCYGKKKFPWRASKGKGSQTLERLVSALEGSKRPRNKEGEDGGKKNYRPKKNVSQARREERGKRHKLEGMFLCGR